MILYCDSSALVKLYVDDAGSERIHGAVAEAVAVATCRINWAEAHAAFSRRVREVPEDLAVIEQARQALADDWPRYVLLEVTQPLVERAAEYADAFALRGYDSIQLAAAKLASESIGEPCGFACFDNRLGKAARLLGMALVA